MLGVKQCNEMSVSRSTNATPVILCLDAYNNTRSILSAKVIFAPAYSGLPSCLI